MRSAGRARAVEVGDSGAVCESSASDSHRDVVAAVVDGLDRRHVHVARVAYFTFLATVSYQAKWQRPGGVIRRSLALPLAPRFGRTALAARGRLVADRSTAVRDKSSSLPRGRVGVRARRQQYPLSFVKIPSIALLR